VIADVPPEELDVPQDRPGDLFESNDIFCSTCLKNQRLYIATLNEYLPDPDDPDYEDIAKSIPEYKKTLEQRYPQCCAQCEPRVRGKLQQATYAARSDHMRRMLERSRARRISNRWGWRSLVVSCGGIAYFVSLAIQLVWHGLASQSMDTNGTCFQQPVPLASVKNVEQYMGLSLALALLSVWWNPKWQYKLKDEGRLVGLNAYYRLQLVALALRYGAWVLLSERPFPMTHSVFLVGIVVLSGRALWTVRVDSTPLVNWEYEQPALVTKTQYVPPQRRQESFAIGNLAPATRPSLQQWRPPTPPSSEDQMDWAPSYNFDPLKQPRYRVGPSPFHSALPAVAGQSIGLPPGHFDKRDRLPQTKTTESVMAEPKFFPPDADTGLESIFGQVFSLKDPALREAPVPVPQPAPARQAPLSQAPLVSAALLLLALVLWSTSDVLAVAFPSIRLYVLGLAAMISLLRAVSRKMHMVAIATAVEVVALAWIGLQAPTPSYEKLGAGILSMLTLQEIVAYAQAERVEVLVEGDPP
jgi:Ima1 N-terminal domain